MNKKIILNVVGLLILLFALFPTSITIPNINPIIPQPNINLDIEKPSDDILNRVKQITNYITNKEDKINLAVFNYVFSKRLMTYKTDSQKINDLYVLAGEDFFKGSLKGKYEKLSSDIKSIFMDILGDKNHMLSEEEKLSLKNNFSGLAWSLIQ